MSKAKRKTITIPAPLARPGDYVLVLNYRMKPPQWETGEMTRVVYSHQVPWTRDGRHGIHPGRWTYTVVIERPVVDRGQYRRPLGGGYTIDVGDDAIGARA